MTIEVELENAPPGLLRLQHGRVYLNDRNAWLRYVQKLYDAREPGKHNLIPTEFPCLIETVVHRGSVSGEIWYEHRVFSREDVEREIEHRKRWLRRFYNPRRIERVKA